MQNRASEQIFMLAIISGNLQANRRSARGLTKDSYFFRVAAERADVVLDPLERHPLVEETEVYGVVGNCCRSGWVG
jgi:hypothetical protein